jgi:hypothetical protein
VTVSNESKSGSTIPTLSALPLWTLDATWITPSPAPPIEENQAS